jgi:hypothetical protein
MPGLARQPDLGFRLLSAVASGVQDADPAALLKGAAPRLAEGMMEGLPEVKLVNCGRSATN